jgi:hypothetical protein
MLKIMKTRTLLSDATMVWSKIGGFDAIGQWHPAVAECQIIRNEASERRILTLQDGSTLVEERIDDRSLPMCYSYRIVEGPLPVANYTSTFSVQALGAGTQLLWSGEYEARGAGESEVQAIIGGIYESGLAAIATIIT